MEFDNKKCILIEKLNDSKKVEIGFVCFLLSQECLDEYIEKKQPVVATWPTTKVKEAKEMARTINEIKFETIPVIVLAKGIWSDMKERLKYYQKKGVMPSQLKEDRKKNSRKIMSSEDDEGETKKPPKKSIDAKKSKQKKDISLMETLDQLKKDNKKMFESDSDDNSNHSEHTSPLKIDSPNKTAINEEEIFEMLSSKSIEEKFGKVQDETVLKISLIEYEDDSEKQIEPILTKTMSFEKNDKKTENYCTIPVLTPLNNESKKNKESINEDNSEDRSFSFLNETNDSFDELKKKFDLLTEETKKLSEELAKEKKLHQNTMEENEKMKENMLQIRSLTRVSSSSEKNLKMGTKRSLKKDTIELNNENKKPRFSPVETSSSIVASKKTARTEEGSSTSKQSSVNQKHSEVEKYDLSQKQLDKCRASSIGAFTTNLMNEVFTLEEMATSTVRGVEPSANNNVTEPRPALNKSKLDGIKRAVRQKFTNQKNYKDNDKLINLAVRTVMKESKNRYKLMYGI